MASSRWRRLGVAVAVLVALPLVLSLVAKALISEDQLVAEIAAQVTNATGAEFEPGQVSLKMVGGLGLSLSDGHLRGTGAQLRRRLGTGQNIGAYDLEFSRLEISLGLWPLLQQQVVVKALRLQADRLLVEVDGDPLRLLNTEILVTDLRVDLAAIPPTDDTAPGNQIPPDLAFKLQVRAEQFIQRGTPWQEVRLSGAWTVRQFAINELAANLEQGQLQVTGSVDYRGDPWGRLTWKARLDELPADLLLRPYLPEVAARLECGLSGDVNGSVVLWDLANAQQDLVVDGQLTAGDGVLHAADWLQDVSRYLGERQDLKTVGFSRLTHQFEVAEGRYLIDTLEIDGHDTDWQASGWLDFGGDIGLKVAVRLPAGFTPDLGAMSFLAETMRDDEGRVRLGLNLTGQAAAPMIGLDLAGLGGRR